MITVVLRRPCSNLGRMIHADVRSRFQTSETDKYGIPLEASFLVHYTQKLRWLMRDIPVTGDSQSKGYEKINAFYLQSTS